MLLSLSPHPPLSKTYPRVRILKKQKPSRRVLVYPDFNLSMTIRGKGVVACECPVLKNVVLAHLVWL